jgi:short-subunit dehydrogenase
MGSIYCTSAAINSIIKTSGMVIGISSIAGFAPLCGRTGYAAAKHGLVGFLGTLRTELVDTGARVMIVHATYIQTNIEKHLLGADGQPKYQPGQQQTTRQTSGNVLMPDEAAEQIYQGASEEKRLLLLGENAEASWSFYHADPEKWDEVMLSLNRYVLQE